MNKFNLKNLHNLRCGMVHCRFGDSEGVSIVMAQIEEVLNKSLNLPKKNIFYLVGRSKVKNKRITEEELIFDYNKTNRLMQESYMLGYNDKLKKEIDDKVEKAKDSISNWVKKNKLDFLIVHNSAHPVNFISSLALNRYYEEAEKKGEKTPKYILWWHDSHLERESFVNPAKDVKKYILQGVPGGFVDYILFISSLQFGIAKGFFKELNKIHPGFYNRMKKNHCTVFNTGEAFIERFSDLNSNGIKRLKNKFIKDFKITSLLEKNDLQLTDLLFVLQPTRIVQRKRIDFALEYCYELLKELKEKNVSKALYFLISGHSADKTKEKLVILNEKLRKKYGIKNFFLVFAEDVKTNLGFLEYPRVFANLKGIATYFSDVEGFGNNLLEVLGSGLVPIVYTYPVFKKDIERFNFKLIKFNKFELDKKKIKKSVDLIRNEKKKEQWAKRNLELMKKHFSHGTMAPKLIRAITSERVKKRL